MKPIVLIPARLASQRLAVSADIAKHIPQYATLKAIGYGPGYLYRVVMKQGLLFAVLCFEIGVFLIAFPWSRYWTVNYFAWLSPEW